MAFGIFNIGNAGNTAGGASSTGTNIGSGISHFITNITHVDTSNILGYIIVFLGCIYIYQNIMMIMKNRG